MILNFKLVKVDINYCDYLRKFDNRIAYNKFEKELRPFVGVLFSIGEYEYFAPLSSPKPKHLKMKNTIEFLKLKNGKLGVINFNNMIPVAKKNYSLLDLDTEYYNEAEQVYQKLLKEQLTWLNKNYEQVKNKALKLYDLYINNKLNEQIRNRCCNFKLLEEKCRKYNMETQIFV